MKAPKNLQRSNGWNKRKSKGETCAKEKRAAIQSNAPALDPLIGQLFIR